MIAIYSPCRRVIPVLYAFALLLMQPAVRLLAGDLYNPFPTDLESPRDGADVVLRRLTTHPEGNNLIVKDLDVDWIKTLAERGQRTLYTKANSHNFDFIGMPVGGIGAGELYLGGDGRLWDWDISGSRCEPGSLLTWTTAYEQPHTVRDLHDPSQDVLDEGFIIRTKQGEKVQARTLDRAGFENVTFSGEYPIGSVDYTDPGSPIHVHLEAFSPFIPGDLKDSSYPATILNYTVENISKDKVDCTLAGWMENGAGLVLRQQGSVLLENRAAKGDGRTTLTFDVKPIPASAKAVTVFEDFQSGRFDHWTITGDAFGAKPAKLGSRIYEGTTIVGAEGQFLADSLGEKTGDRAMGTLTSETFVISRSYIEFLLAGANDPKHICVNLLIDGEVARTATGRGDETLRLASWDVRSLLGKTGQLQIVDQSSGVGGHLLVGKIGFSDAPDDLVTIEDQPDVGNLALAMLDDGAEVAARVTGDQSSDACLDAPAAPAAERRVIGRDTKLVGALRRGFTLEPGAKRTLSFVVAWYFPNPLKLGLSTPMNRQYASRFRSAQDVVDHVADDFDRLTKATRSWHDAWYHSTLPHYFLERTLANASTLATSTCYLLGDGRFYSYEGRYSCPGTCTHVLGYQQTLGYLFPEIERSLMEKVEFVPGLGMKADGGVAMRAEYESTPPVDGQAGIILRAYLAHRMNADGSFLRRNYTSIKKATTFLVQKFDPQHAGILEGSQANTMDAPWYGRIPWLSLYYQTALRASAEMADASDDAIGAGSLRAIADTGRPTIENQLFNGEYFFHDPDPAHPQSAGTFNGCPLEQLMGQTWAYEVGLGDVLDPKKAISALDSIWKYNYTTNVGVYRKAFPKGRLLAQPGEGGLIMCTFPHGGEDTVSKTPAGFYCNECWAGSEYEVTALMMWDGLVDKALAEVRTLQARYDGSKRNPWDECEAGSHYTRSMASYGVFTAACGFEYNGPEGYLAFAPRVHPEDFKAAFTSAEGWGSFSQKYLGSGLSAEVALCQGKLRLTTLSLILPTERQSTVVKARVEGRELPVSIHQTGRRVTLRFSPDVTLDAARDLVITVGTAQEAASR